MAICKHHPNVHTLLWVCILKGYLLALWLICTWYMCVMTYFPLFRLVSYQTFHLGAFEWNSPDSNEHSLPSLRLRSSPRIASPQNNINNNIIGKRAIFMCERKPTPHRRRMSQPDRENMANMINPIELVTVVCHGKSMSVSSFHRRRERGKIKDKYTMHVKLF